VVALTRKVRSDRVRTPPRAEYRASRPLPLPLRFHSRFFAGGIQKRNGRQEAGAASTIHICKLHEERGIVWMYLLTRPHFLFMQNQRGFVGVGILIAILVGLAVLGGGAYWWMQRQPSPTAQQTANQPVSSIPNTPPTNTQAAKLPDNQGVASEISFKTRVGNPATITLKVGETATDGTVKIKLDKLDTNRFNQSIATTYVSADVNHDAYSPGGSYFGTAVGGIVGVKEGFLDSAVSTGVIIIKVTDISLSNNTATIMISAGQK